jgi:glucose/arabinose dehydrogenase
VTVRAQHTTDKEHQLNHAIELSDDGRTLYASTSESVYSWPYDPDRTTVENRRTLVHNMNPGGHPTRTLLLSRKVPGLLLISQGSAENIDPLAADRSSGLSQIRAFNLTNMTDDSQPYNYASDGLLIGWGLRNSVGVAEHPVTGGIFSVENSADEIHRRGQDIHEDNPGEELNFHGYLNDSSSFGANYGYPNCFALWNTSDITERGNLTVGSQFVIDDSVNEAITDETCARDYTPPRLTFRAHMAPLDIKFLPSSGSRAFISFHGSWNRDQPAGYRVSSVFFSESTGQPTEPPDSTTAAVDVLYNPDLSVCPRGCLRPAGLAFDPATEERLFVSSDATGEIWVLRQTSPAPDPTSTWSASLSTDTNGGRGPTSTAAAGLGSRSGFGTDGGMMGWLTTIMVAVGCVFVAMI